MTQTVYPPLRCLCQCIHAPVYHAYANDRVSCMIMMRPQTAARRLWTAKAQCDLMDHEGAMSSLSCSNIIARLSLLPMDLQSYYLLKHRTAQHAHPLQHAHRARSSGWDTDSVGNLGQGSAGLHIPGSELTKRIYQHNAEWHCWAMRGAIRNSRIASFSHQATVDHL